MARLRGGLLRGFLVAAFLASICRVQAYTVIFEDPKTGERRERDGSEFTNTISARGLASPGHSKSQSKGAKADSVKLPEMYAWVGPFACGKAEMGMDALQSVRIGGIVNASLDLRDANSRYYAEYNKGGAVSWSRLSPDASGTVQLGFNHGTTVCGWLLGEIVVPPQGACVLAKIVGSVVRAHISGTRITAGAAGTVLTLSGGQHVFISLIRTKEMGSAKLTFQPCGPKVGKIEVIKQGAGNWENGHKTWLEGPAAYDYPDVIDGYILGSAIHVRVRNVGGEFVKGVMLRVMENEHLEGTQSRAGIQMGPRQHAVISAPLKMHEGARIAGQHCKSDGFRVEMAIEYWGHNGGGGREEHSVVLRCRKRDQSFLFTYMDFDFTPQVAGARLPKGENCGKKKCQVLMSMHGMDVTAQRQADSYSSKKGMWVLAPHGRNIHAFNWQGPGHWSAVRSLEALYALSGTFWGGAYAASAEKGVVYTGHSNGGFGAVLMAVHNPMSVLGLAPQAGMLTLGDNGLGAMSYPADPALHAIYDASVAEYRADVLISNIRGVPYLARTGANDVTISPMMSRRMTRLVCEQSFKKLDGAGQDSCDIRELEGKGHWWWDTLSKMDGGVLDDAEMKSFFKKSMKTQHKWPVPGAIWGGGGRSTKCFSPFSCPRMGGVKVERILPGGRLAEIVVEGKSNGEGLMIMASNVATFSVDACAWIKSNETMSISVSGMGSIGHVTCTRTKNKAERVLDFFCRAGRGIKFVMCPRDPKMAQTCPRDAVDCSATHQCCMGSSGDGGGVSLRRIFAAPFTIVYGTRGSVTEENAYRQAALQLSWDWFYSAGGTTSIMSDVEYEELLDQRMAPHQNVIIMGGPRGNSFAASMGKLNPVQIGMGDDGWSTYKIGPCSFGGPNLGLVTIGGIGPDRHFVLVAGDGVGGEEGGFPKATTMLHDGLFETNHWQHRAPDYALAGTEWGWKGFGGILAAGFWDHNWKFAPEASYVQC